MLLVKETAKGNLQIITSVTDFCDSMGYCEFKIKYFLKGIKPPHTKVTIEGTEAHEKEVAYEREHFPLVPISTEQLADIKRDMEFAREGIFTRFLTKMKIGDKELFILIVGQADKIARSKGTLIVKDTKFPENFQKYLDKPEPFDDQKLQTLLYLNSLFSDTPSLKPKDWFPIPHKEKAWIIHVKDKKTGESVKIFRGVQTEESLRFLNGKLSKFALVALGLIEPEHHNSARKCLKCRLQDDCEDKIC